MLKHLTPVLFATFALLCWHAPAAAEKRIALVLGNADYKHTAPLSNPTNDANDMAEKLRTLDFDVIVATDLNKRDMERRIRLFSERLAGADVALFFYAGHGLGLRADGKNFLVPVDAELKRESDLDFEAIDLDLVLKQMERNARVSLIFLDACRDNPLATRLGQASRNVQPVRGLNRIEKAVGMLIGLATSPGDVALDGEGRNSPYTTALLRHIGAEGQSVNDIMIEVRNDVLKDTGGKQVPWETSSLTGKFYFKPKVDEPSASPAEMAELRQQIDRLQSSQTELLEAQQKQLKLLQDKLETAAAAQDEADDASPGATTLAIADDGPDPAPSAREIAVDPVQDRETEDGTADAADIEEDADIQETASAEETTKVAALDAGATAESETANVSPELDEAALRREIQSALKELECYRGKVDGVWGRGTRGGVEGFNKVADLDLNADRAETATLEALKAWDGANCEPLKVVHPTPQAPRKTTTRKTAPPPSHRTERRHVEEAPPGGPTVRFRDRKTGFDLETDAVHRLLRPAR
jgi:uncharacterized caspase-like protein